MAAIYARVVGSGSLSLVDAAATPPQFSASLSDPAGDEGLEPFVRYTYWAEVRLPAERRGPAGVPLLDPAGGIRAPDAVSRESYARPFSPLSTVCAAAVDARPRHAAAGTTKRDG